MALTNDGTGIVMPVAPTGGMGGLFGGLGDNGLLLIVLFILLGGWGGFGGFGGLGGFGGDLYPWMNQTEQISGGFRDQMMNGTINGIQSAITSGFGDVQNAMCSGFSQAEIAANARQMADMQQNFSLQSQLAQCCCDNKAAIADLKYTIATEACADRAAVSDAMQRILDQMCSDKIDSKNEKIAELQNQLNFANFNASQVAQNNYLQNALTAQTQYIVGLYPPPAAT